ncbi:uncharacterized protein LOC107672441 isoform X1 [Tachysurus ichikawai]
MESHDWSDQLSEEVRQESPWTMRFAADIVIFSESRDQVEGSGTVRKISARIKGKVYRTVVKPAMLYGLETVSLKKRHESELEVAGSDKRRESEYIGRRMLDMELPARKQKGRPKRRYMDVINEDMKLVGASVEDAEDRWRELIRCGDP